MLTGSIITDAIVYLFGGITVTIIVDRLFDYLERS